jgi:hypothetical protein
MAQEGDLGQPAVPLPADLGPARLPSSLTGTASEVALRKTASVEQVTSSHARAKGDDWFVWVLALASLAVPAIILVCVDSIPKDTIAWHEVNVSVDRGDFLIPIMALCVETIRRWWRDVELQHMRSARVLATFFCAAASLICLIATTTAASLPVTPQTGSSIATITCSCLVIGISFGTAAVSASQEKAS